jgi:DNA invertase Pin-like site-specific DNA recombinase
MALIGYARVSTKRQELASQVSALETAGVERIFTEKLTGARRDRPEFDRCLAELRRGDTLVVYSLSRCGRSMAHLLTLVEELGERGIEFKSLKENIETSTATGRLVFHILAALAEFERELTMERVSDGLAAAKARGKKLGRASVIDEERAASIREMLAGGMSVSQVARVTGIGRATLYRHGLHEVA